MRRVNLSVPVPVEALVSRYLTNKLIGHGPLSSRKASEEVPPFDRCTIGYCGLIRYYLQFPAAIPKLKARYPCITRPAATLLVLRRKLSRTTCMF